MNILVCLLFAVTTIELAQAQDSQGPEWTITVKVVDEQSEPVSNAIVKIAWHILPSAAQSIALTNISGPTDLNGMFSTIQRSGSIEVICGAEKTGYYSASRIHDFSKFSIDDPAKWNSIVPLVLRKIGNPIPMYARKVETKIKKEEEPLGFDLVAGDWVSPFGSGEIADIYFTTQRKFVDEREYYAILKLTFPSKGDGIAVVPLPEIDSSSDFRTPRAAAEAGYEPEHVWHFSRSQRSEPVPGYFIRVRTVLNDNGTVKSALYGKIKGSLRFYGSAKPLQPGMGFDYYLNPSPNDRNLEFDPKRNLFTGLPFDEQIREP